MEEESPRRAAVPVFHPALVRGFEVWCEQAAGLLPIPGKDWENKNIHICTFRTMQEIVSTPLLVVCLRGQTGEGRSQCAAEQCSVHVVDVWNNIRLVRESHRWEVGWGNGQVDASECLVLL